MISSMTNYDDFVRETGIQPSSLVKKILAKKQAEISVEEREYFIQNVGRRLRHIHATRLDYEQNWKDRAWGHRFANACINHWADAFLLNPYQYREMNEGIDTVEELELV